MRLFLLALAPLLAALPASAQQLVEPCYKTSTGCTAVSTTNPLPVTGSTSGSALGVAIQPTSSTTYGITPSVTASALSSLVLKAGAGVLYSAYATNLTSTAGFLVVVNLTAAPADGAITPLACVPLPASGVAAVNFAPGPGSVYSTGITAVVTSATTCYTKTTGTITAFIAGSVQ